MHEIERRTSVQKNAIEYRDDGKTPVITGYAAVFESESRNLGGFIETIHRRAFDRVLASKPDVVGVYNHDKNFLLGRTGNGTMTLSVDDYGLRYAILPPATRADVVEAVSRGDVVGSSFAFRTAEANGDVWSRGADGIRRREIREIDLLDDVGPVVRPAYDSSSVVVSRRAIEMAFGESHRPNQTMSNAAKRGLKLASRHENVDLGVVMVAERVAAREILGLEEISLLEGVFRRCLEAKSAGQWAGSPAWIEWQLAGGDSGLKWVQRRTQSTTVPVVDNAPAVTHSEPRAEVSLVPSAAMAAAARKGLKLHEAGRSGDGLKPETVARAKRIAAREELTPEHVREMRAWFRRHKVDKRPGWDKPGDESAGYCAWQLWGGNPGWRWSEAKVAQMGEARDMDEGGEGFPGTLTPANAALYDAYELIVEEHGKWPAGLPDGAHYMDDSPFANRGLVCSNCLFFEGGGACEIVQGDIAANGICKLHVIPEEKMKNERSEAAVVEEAQVDHAEHGQRAPSEPDYAAQVAALKVAALQIHLHGNEPTA
jgi:HK97 family phage prohead protease